ncbi:unnamed protein product [Wuchereria bancrofti]|uniref:Uncharacterized protein n=1 Tax=Wuchereria bancrofti TaxID=6293 RepID=A0A3P7E8Z7_WUCBA|nr:unnamed protein product [Wuchereria bancrofti]
MVIPRTHKMQLSSQSDGDEAIGKGLSPSRRIFSSLLSRSTSSRHRKKKQSQKQLSFDVGLANHQKRKSSKKQSKYRSLRSMLYGLNLKQVSMLLKFSTEILPLKFLQSTYHIFKYYDDL